MTASKQVYNSHGQKYEVPRVRVSSLNELQRADHIAFHRHSGAYWHHAIVERIDRERKEIHVIEYSNTSKEFLNDNCSPPTITGMSIAKVVRGAYKFQDETVYLLKHERCLDPEDVIKKAVEKLGEKEYHPVTNNCEHFAMWCKTGNSTSDQVNKAKGIAKKEAGKSVVAPFAAKLITNKAAKEGEQETQQSGVQQARKENVPQTEQVANDAENLSGQEILEETGEILTQEIVKSGTRLLAEEIVAQTASKAGEEVAKTGAREGSKKVAAQSANGAVAGAACLIPVAIEGMFAAYDIHCAKEDMRRGTIDRREFKRVVKKRIIVGTGNAGGSTVGATIGQALIPVPIVGAVVGATVGGIAGHFVGNLMSNSWL